jgi:ABC-type Zn uptake system ZnuABC Zn-binding protein ZnuA
VDSDTPVASLEIVNFQHRTLVNVSVACVSALLLAACGNGSSSGPSSQSSQDSAKVARDECLSGDPIDGRPIRIVTTVAPVTSLVAAIVGDSGGDIQGVVPEGTNSHEFEPPPSAAAVLEKGDVIFINGLVLEEPTKDLAEANVSSSTVICELGTAILPETEWLYDFSFPKEGGKPNPHLWTNPPMAKEYAQLIRDVLIQIDPANTEEYETNYEDIARVIDELDEAMMTATRTIPVDQRKLLTYHDAYAYFAVHYGWTVIGAIQPQSFEEPSPKEIADLIKQVENENVQAIFGSEVFPSPVLEQIGREAGVRYVDVLRDDDLTGEPGDPEHSWAGLMLFNFITMVEALGGDASALRALDVTVAAPDLAFYPQ